MGTGAKVWPGHDVDHPPLSSAEVKNRVELYLYSPLRAFVAYDRVKPTCLVLHKRRKPARLINIFINDGTTLVPSRDFI
jgi:hypothetical protein